MTRVQVNDVQLAVEEAGAGPPVVFVHGGWTDRHAWDAVTPALTDRHRVIWYDRCGHSQSERPAGRHGVEAHGADLAGLIDELDAAPSHVVTSSIGGNIALSMAARYPDVVASLCLHEPPLLGLADDPRLEDTRQREEVVRGLIRQGDHETAARVFFDELAVGPGAWEMFPESLRQTLARNAPAWLEECPDPWSVPTVVDIGDIAVPVLLTGGGAHPPDYPYPLTEVLDRLHDLLPNAERYTFEGAGHVPHHSHPQELARVVGGFLGKQANTPP